MAASWILIPCLVALRNEFNELSPKRDKASDGSIGNTAHAGGSSDHNPDETGNTPSEDADHINEVHAIDVDSSGPWPNGATFDLLVNEIVTRHRQGLDDRLQNVIYNRRIASRTWGWTWRDYTGTSAHTEHGHFSGRYESVHESNTRPWGLTARFLQEDFPVDQNTFNTLMTGWAKSSAGRAAIADAVLHTPVGNEAYPARDLADFANDIWPVRDDYVGDGKGAATNPPKPGSLGALIKSVVIDASTPPPPAQPTAKPAAPAKQAGKA